MLLHTQEDFIPEEMIIVDTEDGAEVFAYGELQVGGQLTVHLKDANTSKQRWARPCCTN
jgi:hypothetical protein